MFKNYLKTTIRNIRRHKGYSLINISGLAIGMACTIFVLLWIQDELSFDRFHENALHIYRIIQERQFTEETVHSAMTPPPLGSALTNNFPEITNFSRYNGFFGEIILRYGEKAFYERGGAYVDPSFLEMFSFPFVKGDPRTALSELFSIVLTEAMAEKYFGDVDPMGQTLHLEGETTQFTVTGIIKNVPRNSHLPFEFLVPQNLRERWGDDLNDWMAYPQYTYILIQENSSMREVNQKIAAYLTKVNPESKDRLYLQPLTRIHLYSSFTNDNYATLGDIHTVYIFSAIAVFVLIIACINFINMTTARSFNRAREIGIRKVVGSQRIDIIRQFLGESVVLSLISFGLAVVLVELFLPAFNQFSGKELSAQIWNSRTMLRLFMVIIFTGILSGGYPSLYLSSFQPIRVLRRSPAGTDGRSSSLRTILVVFQFALSIGLIICTIILQSQLNYIRNKSLGFQKEHIIYIQARRDMARQFPLFKTELLRDSNILSVSATSNVTGAVPATSANVYWQGKNVDENKVWAFLFVYYDYFETLNIRMTEGRIFSEEIPTDATEAFIVNEEAARLIGVGSVIGKRVGMGDRNGAIIGVVNNYHFHSLHQKIHPLVVQIRPELCNYLLIRINPQNVSETIDFLKETWHRFLPNFPFRYHFLDDTVEKMYQIEIRMGKVFITFTLIAIFISCLGLFSLASYTTEHRTKEIGVRKVFGASTRSIVHLLSIEFVKWILVSNIIAWPMGYFVMNKFLQYFAYRVSIGFWSFILSAVLALIVALFTVSCQSVRAATANPVEVLRYE